MRGLNVRTLMVFGAIAAFQALAGCNRVVTTTILLHQTASPPYYEVGHKVSAKDVVTWTADSAFNIQFESGNPCSNAPTGTVGMVDYFDSTQHGPQWEVRCVIKSALGARTWTYGASSKPPDRHVVQCTGCTLGSD